MEIQSMTTIYNTYCQSNHLTEFTGGMSLLPPTLNFNTVWANASFFQNLTIYLTVIIITLIYILLIIVSRLLDKNDQAKLGFIRLRHLKNEKYLYEVIFYTGSRKQASTDSKVFFYADGTLGHTDVLLLKARKRQVFRRGGIDSFIISTSRSLGDLLYVKVWHDNSGKGGNASWYLNHIIIHDLQTREKHYFICEKWLAVEKDDGKIERLIPISGDSQKKELAYLTKQKAKQNITDGYLWFSIFAKPLQSSLNRTDRTTNCFLLLYLIMLTNIMYYGRKSQNSDSTCYGISIGSVCVTLESTLLSLIINTMLFVPTFIVLELFKRSKMKKSHTSKLREFIGIRNYKLKPIKRKLINARFPWWVKIIAYAISIIGMILCIFFVILYGITLGDVAAQKWLSSFVLSLILTIVLTGPIKALLTAFLLSVIFRKAEDRDDLINDPDDDDSPINPYALHLTSDKFKNENRVN